MAKYRKLGKTSSQRKALLRNQVTALLYHGRIVTTVSDGKKIAKFETVEREIKKDLPSRLHARRQILRVLYPIVDVPKENAGRKRNTKKVDLAGKLFDEYGPKYAGRNGGYTRIIKIGPRRGDAAMEVILELV